MTSRLPSRCDSKESSSPLHWKQNFSPAQNTSAPRMSVSRNAFSDADSPPPIDKVPVYWNSCNEADMIHRVETCLNRREPLFEAGFPDDPTGNRIFSSRPPSSLSAKEVLRHKIRDGGRSFGVLSNEECDQGATPDLNIALRIPLQQFDSKFPLDERCSTSFLHRSEVFQVGAPPSRLESASSRGLGRLSRALLQVDSVSVHHRNRAMADAGMFKRLFGGCKPLERTRPSGYIRSKNSGRNMGRCQSPLPKPGHQSLRLLVTVAFLLVAFVLTSGLFATKHVDNVPRRDKNMGVKHGRFGGNAQDNFTGVDASPGGRQENTYDDNGTRKRNLVLADALLSSGTATSIGWSPLNRREKYAP